MHLKSKSFVIVLILAAAFSGRASAVTPYVTPLLIIDDSNPSAVTFTATDYNPFRSDSSHYFTDGIDLENFFSDNSLGQDNFNTSGTLTTFLDGTPDYNMSHSDDVTGGYDNSDYQDLNIWASADDVSPLQHFSTSSQAFSGTATIDMTAEAAYLLPVGTIGSIFAGYSYNLPKTGESDGPAFDTVGEDNFLMYLGDYEIVPEPSQWTLLLLGAVGLFSLHRFLSTRANS